MLAKGAQVGLKTTRMHDQVSASRSATPASGSGRVRWPAEWEPHEAVWLAWPHDLDEWGGDLSGPRREVAALARAIADVDGEPGTTGAEAGRARGERIELLVVDEAAEAEAREALVGVPARFHRVPYGDIWLRDTGPVFAYGRGPELMAACFGWNGWGGSYLLEHDAEVGGRIAALVGAAAVRHDWVLEGGGIDGDGAGTALTTRECLQNPNRNPGLDEAAVEARLHAALGVERVVWLDRGLKNDHTDGHVDTLARFVAPGRVVCMRAHEPGDPNRAALEQIARDLGAARDAGGRRLEVVEMPSPGAVYDSAGELMPASFANFYIGDRVVVVPVYGTRYDHQAVDAIAALFPGRRTVGLEARAVLAGGGAFHCITREQPRAPAGAAGDGEESP
ncbi:agmatine deiminase family protein [Haliangium sp.]|uniref:agmatine deiminase family protein n=1 Tax=Haliangium sp. TaxID=2663208 RepID=UPI003D11CCF1